MNATYDVEELLTRELHGVADEVQVPAVPALPSSPPASRPTTVRWLPLMAAAAVLLVLLGAVAVVSNLGDERRISPAPSPDDAVELSTEAPTGPYLLGDVLYAGGERVPGSFGMVYGTSAGWIAYRRDGTWVRGNPREVVDMEGLMPQGPAISPNGAYVAAVYDEGGRGMLNGFETEWAGEGMGLGLEVPLTDDDEVGVRVGAVTDDGRVVASGRGVSVLWQPYDGDVTGTDLSRTAPQQLVWQATAAGLVVVDGSDGSRGPESGDVYLADLGADGDLTRTADLPNFGGQLAASPTWLAWASADSIGGEVEWIDTLQARRVEGGSAVELSPPDGWHFRVGSWTFEDEEHLVTPVVDDADTHRMVRCAPALGECVLLAAP